MNCIRLQKYNKKENKLPLPAGCHDALESSQKNTAIRRLDLLSGASWVPLCFGLIPAQIKSAFSCPYVSLNMYFFLLWKQKKVVRKMFMLLFSI